MFQERYCFQVTSNHFFFSHLKENNIFQNQSYRTSMAKNKLTFKICFKGIVIFEIQYM